MIYRRASETPCERCRQGTETLYFAAGRALCAACWGTGHDEAYRRGRLAGWRSGVAVGVALSVGVVLAATGAGLVGFAWLMAWLKGGL